MKAIQATLDEEQKTTVNNYYGKSTKININNGLKY